MSALQLIASGLAVGCVYALLGVGFGLTWGALGIVNVAHTAFAVLGAYAAYKGLADFGVDPLLSLLIIIPVFFMLGVLVYVVLVRNLKSRVKDVGSASIVLTFGLAIVLENVMSQSFGPDPRVLRTSYSQRVFDVGPITLQGGELVAAVLALCVLVGLILFLKHTYLGQALRAVEQEPDGAAVCGIDVSRVHAISCGLATATAGIAGVGLSMLYNFNPSSHLSWLVIIFLVVILGGVGSVTGSAVVGLGTGVLVSLSTLWVPYAWVNLVLFVLLIAVLLVRPQGLFQP